MFFLKTSNVTNELDLNNILFILSRLHTRTIQTYIVNIILDLITLTFIGKLEQKIYRLSTFKHIYQDTPYIIL